jgi:hypothetical protein
MIQWPNYYLNEISIMFFDVDLISFRIRMNVHIANLNKSQLANQILRNDMDYCWSRASGRFGSNSSMGLPEGSSTMV